MDNNIMQEPFGLLDASKEQEFLTDVFIDSLPFLNESVNPSVSILVGKRGTGKTALAYYFGFENSSYDLYVRLDEPSIFNNVFNYIGKHFENSQQPLIAEHISQIWEVAFWTSILSKAKNHLDFPPGGVVDKIFQGLKDSSPVSSNSSEIITLVFRSIVEIAGGSTATLTTISEKLNAYFHSREFENARQAFNNFLINRKAVLVIDTLDQYDIRNNSMQVALSAMLHTVTKFSRGGKNNNLSIKCFIPQEILPYILYSGVLNVGKTFDRPVYLDWLPKDLLHLLCKRLFKFLTKSYPSEIEKIGEIDFNDRHSLLENLWFRYFPKTISNKKHSESSLTYILRHTLMRPRQAIWICNAIARESQKDGTFPIMTEEQIKRGLNAVIELVAIDVVNSFHSIYPNIRKIISYLAGMPSIFKGTSILDQIAPRTKALWTDDDYSSRLLHRLVTEVGIVGTVKDETSTYYVADFAYSTKGYELELPNNGLSVVHPLFYNMLKIRDNDDRYVYPRTAL